MTNRPWLRAIEPKPEDLTTDELQQLGNRLVEKSRHDAVEAMKASLVPEFITPPSRLTVPGIRRWRAQIRTAMKKWNEADASLSELLNAIDSKTRYTTKETE